MMRTPSAPAPVTGNPAFGRYAADFAGEASASGLPSGAAGGPGARAGMTVAGTAARTVLFVAVLVIGGWWGWSSATTPVAEDIGSGYGNTTVTLPGGFWLASLAALVLGLVIAVNPRAAPVGGLVYSVLQGYVLGAISAAYDAQTEGIVGAAVVTTLCVFLAALVLYATRLVRPTQRLAFGVAAGIGGLVLFWFLVSVVSLFDWGWRYSDSFRTVGIVVGLVAVVLAALSFTLDFAQIESGVRAGAPRAFEWYSAWALTVTLIWLYVEILRLLALLARNR